MYDVDDLPGVDSELESIEDDLIDFLGERLDAISPLVSKPPLEKIIGETLATLARSQDECVVRIREKICEFYMQVKLEESQEAQDTELDYERFKNRVPEEVDRGLTWFILWFGKYILKVNFLPDMCFVFSRIWKVLNKLHLGIQDLDNQVIWNEAFKECQTNIGSLMWFKGRETVLLEFITRMSQFICRTFG